MRFLSFRWTLTWLPWIGEVVTCWGGLLWLDRRRGPDPAARPGAVVTGTTTSTRPPLDGLPIISRRVGKD